MRPERWRQVGEIYNAVLEQRPQDREAFLQQACAGDESVRKEVASLLACEQSAPVEQFMERRATEAVAQAPDLSGNRSAALCGQTISHYQVREKLGQGGMGIVYKALDTRLNRPVALKVLLPDRVWDPERKRRFAKEARAASALNHPNIVTIYDIDQVNGIDLIAMEHLAGKPLGELISRSGMRVGQALKIAIQIAEGLSRAHNAGIIHRDLKPSNIMVTDDGLVKILDFGLAKLMEGSLGQQGCAEASLSTDTSLSTGKGAIIGTAAYMSPEQAEAKQVDARNDIFAFGSVLYEMVTGRRAFHGDSFVSTLAAVLDDDPKPVSQLGSDIPPALERVIHRCLRKDPARRWQHIDDVKIELEDLKEESESQGGSAQSAVRRRRWWLCGAALAGLSILTAGVWLLSGARVTAGQAVDVTKHRYTPIAFASITRSIAEGGGTGANTPAWSPDGKSIVYSADGLRLQSIDGVESLRLTQGGVWPFFSANGSRVYYFDSDSAQNSRELWSISIAGGPPQRLLSDLGGFGPVLGGAAESRDGNALAVVRSLKTGGDEMSVWVSSPPGAPPRAYPGSPTGRNLDRAHLRFSPDGSKLLLTLAPSGGPVQWWLLRWPPPTAAQPNTVWRLFENGPRGSYGTAGDWLTDSRHIIVAVHEDWASGGPLWIADTVTGTWLRITPGPFQCTAPRVSHNGRVLFHMAKREEHAIGISLDGSPVQPLLPGLRQEQYPSWSRVAEQILFVTDQRGEPEIWLAARNEGWQRPVVTQRDFPPEQGRRQFVSPAFSPEGTRIAYTSQGAIWISPVAGGPPVRICEGYSPTWSPDGAWLAFVNNPRATKTTLMKVMVGRPQNIVTICSSPRRWLPRWSPDGKWITAQLPGGFGVIAPDGTASKVLYKGLLDWASACGWSHDGSVLYVAYLTAYGRVLSAFDPFTGGERRVRDLGPMDFSYAPYHSSGLSISPDGKCLAASTLNLRLEPWVLDGLEPPRSFWARLFSR